MEKLLALLGVFLLLTCAQCSESSRNKNRQPEDQDISDEQREQELNEAKKRGDIEDNYKGWDYDEAGHTSQ